MQRVYIDDVAYLWCLVRAPHALRFELGRRPECPPLLVYGPGEVRMS